MNEMRTTRGRGTAVRGALVLAAVAALLSARTAYSDDRMQADQLVEKARLTLQNFQCDETMGPYRALLQKAQGVMVIPNLLKGAFVVGASGGSGVLMVRDEKTRAWSQPAFYTLGGGSFGPQIGGQSSEVILLAMTERGVKSFLTNSLKLGADAGIAAGPVGVGASAATANLSADILSFSRSKGAYGGISMDGTVVAVRDDLNRAYYNRQASTVDILVKHDVTSSRSVPLAHFLESSASGRMSRERCPTASTGNRGTTDRTVAGL